MRCKTHSRFGKNRFDDQRSTIDKIIQLFVSGPWKPAGQNYIIPLGILCVSAITLTFKTLRTSKRMNTAAHFWIRVWTSFNWWQYVRSFYYITNNERVGVEETNYIIHYYCWHWEEKNVKTRSAEAEKFKEVKRPKRLRLPLFNDERQSPPSNVRKRILFKV